MSGVVPDRRCDEARYQSVGLHSVPTEEHREIGPRHRAEAARAAVSATLISGAAIDVRSMANADIRQTAGSGDNCLRLGDTARRLPVFRGHSASEQDRLPRVSRDRPNWNARAPRHGRRSRPGARLSAQIFHTVRESRALRRSAQARRCPATRRARHAGAHSWTRYSPQGIQAHQSSWRRLSHNGLACADRSASRIVHGCIPSIAIVRSAATVIAPISTAAPPDPRQSESESTNTAHPPNASTMITHA